MSETVFVLWASFDAARSEQLRVPADETLKRRDRVVPLILDAFLFKGASKDPSVEDRSAKR